MPKVISYLACGCAIMEGGGRTWCPTCEASISASPDNRYPIKLRRELQWFAEAQEGVLRDNDHKGGWKGMHPFALMHRLYEEINELHKEVLTYEGGDTRRERCILKEACDVANFAMFIADVYGLLNREVAPE